MNIRRGIFLAVALFSSSFLNLAVTSAWSQIIPPTRRTVWQGNVGVPGGIPNRQTICRTFLPGASATEINEALAKCPDNQVVQLGTGTFNLTSALVITRDSITLRGAASPGKTILTGINGRVIFIYSRELADEWTNPVAAHHVNVVNGYSQGSRSLNISSVNLAGTPSVVPLGRLIYMDQLNDADTDARSTGGGAPGQGLYTSIANPNTGADRWQQQVFKITGVNGNTLSVDPPVAMPNWSANLSPQIWWQTSNPVNFSGIEDLTINGTYDQSFDGIVQLYNTYGCWVKNVHVTGGRRSIYLEYTARSEVRHSRVDGVGIYDPYGISVYHSSGALVEDNIVYNITGANILLTGSTASAYTYNYTTHFNLSTWSFGALSFHGNHPTMNLFEGNVGANMWTADNQWGSAGYNTAFRNYFTGHDESNTSSYINNEQAICIAAKNRHFNVVGNVLGTPGRNTAYEDAAVCGPGNETKRVFLIGNENSYCQAGAYDPLTYSSLLRVLNWDSANNRIVDAGNFTAADLPNSLLYDEKPSWWGTTLPWPPVDPFNRSRSIDPANTPAGFRFKNAPVQPQSTPIAPARLRVN